MNAATLATLHLDKRALAEHARKDRDASVRVPAAPASESTTAGGDARGFETLQDAYSLHQFMIRKGVAIEGTPEFSSFKRAHASQITRVPRTHTPFPDVRVTRTAPLVPRTPLS